MNKLILVAAISALISGTAFADYQGYRPSNPQTVTATGSVSNQQYQIAGSSIPTTQIQTQSGVSSPIAVVGAYQVVNGAPGGIVAAFGGRVNGSPIVSGGSVVATNGGTAIPVAIGSIDVVLKNALNTTTTTNPVVFRGFGDPRR